MATFNQQTANSKSASDKPLSELFKDLTQEFGTLVRQEVMLAKTELSDKAAKVGKDIGMLAVGGAIAYAGLLAIVAAIVLMLVQTGLSAWASALIIGIIVAVIGAFLAIKGLNALKQEDLTPKQTIQKVQEDVKWTKEQMSS